MSDLTFNWHERSDDFLGWALVAMMTRGEGAPDVGFHQVISDLSDGFRKVELGITVNGEPIDAEHFMKRLEMAVDDGIERGVANKMSEMPDLDELNEAVNAVQRSAADAVRKIATLHGIELREERW